MPVKLSSIFRIYSEINPPQELRNQFDDDSKKVARECNDGGTVRQSTSNGYFWAQLIQNNDNVPNGTFTIVYTKKRAGSGVAYGIKVAVPQPPFFTDQNPSTINCDD